MFNCLVVKVGAIGLLLFGAELSFGDQEVGVNAHREAIERRLTQLQNVSARYTCTFTYLAPSELVTPEKGGLYTGDWSYDCFFSFLDGRAIFDKETLPETLEYAKKGGWLETKREIRAFSHDRAESFTIQPNYADGFGSIIDKDVLPSDIVFDHALGLRLWERNSWLRPTDVASAALEEGKQISLTFVDDEQQRHRLAFDPSLNYALTTVSVTDHAGREFYNIAASDFVVVDGLFLPQTILARRLGFNPGQPQPAERQRVRISVHGYLLGDPENAPERYHLAWVKDTLVKDQRLGLLMRMGTTRKISDLDLVEVAMNMSHPPDPTAVAVESPIHGNWSALPWIFGATSLACGIAIGLSYWRRPRREGHARK